MHFHGAPVNLSDSSRYARNFYGTIRPSERSMDNMLAEIVIRHTSVQAQRASLRKAVELRAP